MASESTYFTIPIRLEAPMQSWGVESRFKYRDSLKEPTKSGVIGIISSAMGRDRKDDLSDLTACAFGVRVDREPKVLVDFHTAGKGGFMRASGTVEHSDVETSWRYYLSDASFLVVLSYKDESVANQVLEALKTPKRVPFLGRKGFVTSQPLLSGDVLKTTLFSRLQSVSATDIESDPVRFVVDQDQVPEEVVISRHKTQSDEPLNYQKRDFLPREMVEFRMILSQLEMHEEKV